MQKRKVSAIKKTVIESKFIAVTTISFLALLAALSFAPAAFATSSSNCTPNNCNVHNFTFDLGLLGPVPCGPNAGVLQGPTDAFLVGNGVFHASADGSHATSTIEGDITAPLVNGVVYTGHMESWFAMEITSDGHAEASDTLNIHLMGTDGSTLDSHAILHITILPDGTITANVANLVCN